MNISFFLKPKVEVSYLTESCPVQKAIDDMLHSGLHSDSCGRCQG